MAIVGSSAPVLFLTYYKITDSSVPGLFDIYLEFKRVPQLTTVPPPVNSNTVYKIDLYPYPNSEDTVKYTPSQVIASSDGNYYYVTQTNVRMTTEIPYNGVFSFGDTTVISSEVFSIKAIATELFPSVSSIFVSMIIGLVVIALFLLLISYILRNISS